MVRDVRNAAYAYDLFETDPGAATERFFPPPAAVSIGDSVHSPRTRLSPILVTLSLFSWPTTRGGSRFFFLPAKRIRSALSDVPEAHVTSNFERVRRRPPALKTLPPPLPPRTRSAALPTLPVALAAPRPSDAVGSCARRARAAYGCRHDRVTPPYTCFPARVPPRMLAVCASVSACTLAAVACHPHTPAPAYPTPAHSMYSHGAPHVRPTYRTRTQPESPTCSQYGPPLSLPCQRRSLSFYLIYLSRAFLGVLSDRARAIAMEVRLFEYRRHYSSWEKAAQSFVASPWADRAASYLPPIKTLCFAL
ncbi:hypothetical protein DFH08DRAFT_966717 [Mycena albidolilacea]|uniref:Uncharacterized protein n=1 Tax=Mycena albidolilacea TaxID=1033008 RepID=A0AAD7EJJ4_9AGAR|nr:hypothetical protein DFH08DRAFT_966717 [Mycena albidolilacea]